MMSRIVISLFVLNFLAGISMYALKEAGFIPSYIVSPSLQDLNQLINKSNLEDFDVRDTMIFGDFLKALNVLRSMFTGEHMAYLVAALGNDRSGWMHLMLQGLYTLSLTFLLLKIIANRYFD